MSDNDIRQFGIDAYDRWTAMWNGDLDLAAKIMAPEFVLRYAQAGTEAFDEVRTPQQLAGIIAAWHREHRGLRFVAEGAPVVDLARVDGAPAGLVARPYLASFTGEDARTIARSGTDTLRITNGLISEVWSVSSGSAGRTFYR
ncbi:nuclear transport factor 2 family protein [Streptomyces xanthophaeus]|uniref:nuclear transport factor 2 family protein n=1 Tax=Streptomyces xanthophaeus TaxID=67385 RepID=UPI0026470917|nr:nuclear transport factor 2 family protein [Streptomyces xanthophaeus]WKD33587.1 ester cyclase [Streptomyces xanthophaeus]